MPDVELRPLERVILKLVDEGASIPEIGRRIGKRPGTVRRIRTMIEYKKEIKPAPRRQRDRTPIEAVVLRLRAEGENYGTIGARLGRSGANVRRIESYAQFKTSTD